MSEAFFNKLRLHDIIISLSPNDKIEDKTEFLRKYDNGNSIWEVNEIAEIRQDYTAGNLNNIFETYRNEQSGNVDNYSYKEDYALKRELNDLSEEENQRLEELVDSLGPKYDISSNILIKFAKYPQETYKKLMSYIDSMKLAEDIGKTVLKNLVDISPENFERIYKYTSIESREDEQFNIFSLKELSKLNDEELSKVEKYIYIEGREGCQFSGYDLANLSKIPLEKLKLAEKYMYIEGRGKQQLNGGNIAALCEMDEDTLQETEKYLYIESRGEQQFDVFNIQALTSIDEEFFAKIEKYIGIKERGKDQFNSFDLKFISELSENKLKVVDEFAYVESLGDNQFSCQDIVNFVNMNEKELSVVRKYMNCYRGGKRFTGEDLAALTKLNEDEIKKIEPYMYVKNRGDNQFSGSMLCKIAEMDEMTQKKILKYSYIEEKEDMQFDENALLEIADIPDEEIEELLPFLKMKNVFSIMDALSLKDAFGNNLDLLNRLSSEHPDFNVSDLINFGNIYMQKPDMSLQFYNEHNSNITQIGHDFIIAGDLRNTYEYNLLNNQIIETHYEYKYGVKTIKSQIINTYDADNNPVKTRTVTPGGIAGVPNISETENGITTPVQYSSVDPNNGGITISKTYTSPNGVTSDIYLEKNPDGLMILNYKITQKRKLIGKKTLLDRSMTFQQVTENEFITSVDNKTYKVTADENKITVLDMKTKKKKEIIIDDILLNNAKDIIPQIIMHVPANLLFSMDSDRLQIKYNKNVINNAACGPEIDGDICDIRKIFDSLSIEKTKPKFGIIEMGEQLYTEDLTQGLVSVFLHEYGHFLDFDVEIIDTGDNKQSHFGVISADKDVINSYEKEHAAFMSKTSKTEQDDAKYITEKLQEMVAEVNMLINGIPNAISAERSSILQEYFPETIAKITELLDKRINELTKTTQ